MAIATTENMAGIQQEIRDKVEYLNKHKTPGQSMISTFQVANRHFDWQVDLYANPTFEGAEESEPTESFNEQSIDRIELRNYIQETRYA